MQVEIHTADGFYKDDECVDELLYFKLVEMPFLPRKHDLLIIDGFHLTVDQPVMNIDKQIFEVYTEDTCSTHRSCYDELDEDYKGKGWTEE